jgi:hypothetical protein
MAKRLGFGPDSLIRNRPVGYVVGEKLEAPQAPLTPVDDYQDVKLGPRIHEWIDDNDDPY